MKRNKVWAVIPAHNEQSHIKSVIRSTKKYVDQVVVVDDGSNDKTTKEAKKEKVIVLTHVVNLGKGAALKTGCDYAIKMGANIIIVLDADGQHQPSDIPRFLKALLKYDIVFGYRRESKAMPKLLRFGNNVINLTTRFLYGINLNDTQCGFRAFSKSAYKKIRWGASDYSMESEMVTNVGKNRLRYKQLPIKTIYSNKYKGTTIIDGFKIVMNLFWWRLSK